MPLQVGLEEPASFLSLLHPQGCEWRVLALRIFNLELFCPIGSLSVPHKEQVVVLVKLR